MPAAPLLECRSHFLQRNRKSLMLMRNVAMQNGTIGLRVQESVAFGANLRIRRNPHSTVQTITHHTFLPLQTDTNLSLDYAKLRPVSMLIFDNLC